MTASGRPEQNPGAPRGAVDLTSGSLLPDALVRVLCNDAGGASGNLNSNLPTEPASCGRCAAAVDSEPSWGSLAGSVNGRVPDRGPATWPPAYLECDECPFGPRFPLLPPPVPPRAVLIGKRLMAATPPRPVSREKVLGIGRFISFRGIN